ncbi:phosphatase PAP2 family protein [Methylosinus sp. Ce-a6]|uniref:phosphatase PAP2 family protein n=1 Tax=Methylosinus sp. Ce-a6 TaxID=2172005 RepID=UPI0013598FDA|nr:phosphatase PAP2 family protein [Methylosinus sp. Ce-a6]
MLIASNRRLSLERFVLAETSLRDRLLRADLAGVHLMTRSTKSTLGRLLAIAISKLGNGWIYPILAAAIFALAGSEAWPVVALASLNAALLHTLFPIIKKRIGRPRPFRVDPRLTSLLKILDEHSFPSGHMMTLTGVLAPIVIAWPSAALSALALILSMAWSRIATAHHYPSDVLGGSALGIAMGYPLSACILGHW